MDTDSFSGMGECATLIASHLRGRAAMCPLDSISIISAAIVHAFALITWNR
jgi:hypothetical protein